MPIAKLQSILSQVHKGFRYVTDSEQYGTAEKWVMPSNENKVTGDCEDFALACRQLCRADDIKTRLVYCRTETGGGHLVLASDGWR